MLGQRDALAGVSGVGPISSSRPLVQRGQDRAAQPRPGVVKVGPLRRTARKFVLSTGRRFVGGLSVVGIKCSVEAGECTFSAVRSTCLHGRQPDDPYWWKIDFSSRCRHEP